MKLSTVTISVSCIVALLPWSAQAQAKTTVSPVKITAAAVWQPSTGFLAKADNACGNTDEVINFDLCFMEQMSAAGAPPEAVNFTRMLYKETVPQTAQQTDQQPGLLHALKNFGPVDAAQVWYLRAQEGQYGLFLVNGDPRILDADDEKKLDEKAMEADPLYKKIEQKYPQVEIGPTDRSSATPWPSAQPLPSGGIELIVTYTLLNGCDACEHLGQVHFGWDFDAKGNFLRTVYIPMQPAPKAQRAEH